MQNNQNGSALPASADLDASMLSNSGARPADALNSSVMSGVGGHGPNGHGGAAAGLKMSPHANTLPGGGMRISDDQDPVDMSGIMNQSFSEMVAAQNAMHPPHLNQIGNPAAAQARSSVNPKGGSKGGG